MISRNDRDVAVEAVADLARGLGLRLGVAMVLWLAMLKLLDWCPALPQDWRSFLSIAVAVSGSVAIVSGLARPRRL